jgi:hypothetical protein
MNLSRSSVLAFWANLSPSGAFVLEFHRQQEIFHGAPRNETIRRLKDGQGQLVCVPQVFRRPRQSSSRVELGGSHRIRKHNFDRYYASCLRIDFNSRWRFPVVFGYAILSSSNASITILETINRAFSLSSAGTMYQGA